jgi:NAD(P)-dependent dehydrogenase (short-subunit alcohol dehydrogenase family)
VNVSTGGAPVALVTGASRGIGRAIAISLAEAGYDVAITARTVREGEGPQGLPGSLESVSAAIEERGRRALPVVLDLLDREALVPAVETVLAKWGRLDLLVNNAIYVGPGNDDRFLDVDPLDLEKRIYANLTAQLLLSQRALRAMVEQGGGMVVNISSAAGMSNPRAKVGEGGWALSYGCAKGGFHRAAGVIAVELADQGIHCWNVEPGYVATERVVSDPKLGFIAERGYPPSAVGDAVAWLVGNPEGLTNGRTMRVRDYVVDGAFVPPAAVTA